MRKVLLPILLLWFSAVAFGQTVNVTADAKSILAGAQSSRIKLCLSLVDVTGQVVGDAHVVGVGVIVPQEACVTPDANGHFSTTAYANDSVTSGGATNTTLYRAEWLYNGSPVAGAVYQFLLADGSEDLNTKSPANVVPLVTVVPTDATYMRIDAGNSPATGTWKFSNGVCYSYENGKAVVKVSAACGYTTWALALAACPSTGCILDGTAADTPLAMGAFDTGSNTKPVTVRLGRTLASGCFTATQITVRQGLDLGGVDILDSCLTSAGTNAQPILVIPQTNNNAITTKIHDLTINGLPGNTSQDGIFFDASTLTNAGTELTQYDNLIFSGFNGSSIHLKATLDGVSGSIGAIQGITLTNITATRPTGATGATQNALRIEGGVGQISLHNCWLNGATNDTGTNVFVGTTGTQAPYSIHFYDTTCQNGNCYLFDGGTSITTENDHFENIKGAYSLANTSQLLVGVNLKTPHINANVGVNAGNGYVINIPNTVTNADVTLDTPFVYSTPDNLVKNSAGNSASVHVRNVQTFNSSTPTNVYVSSGVTGTLAPTATVDLKCWDTVQATASGTSMTTFRSCKMPGESITIYATGGSIQFATGGNLSLGTQTSPMVVPSGDSATFMRVDAGTPAFVLTALSTKTLTNPVINGTLTGTGIATGTLKKGSGSGYTSASTTYVVVDATNLCYTVTIPTGWKLGIQVAGTAGTSTAAVAFSVALTDNGACSTANAGLLQEISTIGPSAGTAIPFAFSYMITGDGASHNIALQYKTSNGADSVLIGNSSASLTPTMAFTLFPAN